MKLPSSLPQLSSRKMRFSSVAVASSSVARPVWAWTGAALGMLLALLTQAPAHWLAWGLALATGERLLLLNPSGSVWQGTAVLALAPPGRPEEALSLPGLVRWNLRPQWSGLQLDLLADCCTQAQQPLRVFWTQHVSSTELRTEWPASQWPTPWLTGLGTPWNTMALGGQMQLQSNLSMQRVEGRWLSQGQAQLVLRQVSSPLSTLSPLGEYQLDLQGGPSLQMQLSTLSGDLVLQGQGQWSGDRLHFRGTAQARAQREAVLGSLLNLLGPRRGNQSQISIG